MFRSAILWFNLIAPVAAVVVIWKGHPWPWALGIVVAGYALWLWATLMPSSGWWGSVVTGLPTSDSKVWITIDDGPDPADTPELLDLLEQHGARATFFLIGAKAERHPQLVRDIVGRGHEVANHTYHHPASWFWFYGWGGTYREISKGAGILKRIVPQVTPRWFRAPVGMKNHHVHSILKEQGLQLVAWSVRDCDDESKGKHQILKRLEKGIKPGAIILLHEGGVDEKGERMAPQVLAGLLERLKAGGYQAVLPGS